MGGKKNHPSKSVKEVCPDWLDVSEAHLRRASPPLRPPPSLSRQDGVTGLAHLVQPVSIILQSYFIV